MVSLGYLPQLSLCPGKPCIHLRYQSGFDHSSTSDHMWKIILSWTPITSSSSIHAPSISNEMNSFRCRYVSCFSALNAGPISNTLSKPPRTASCLYNCGLWERYASVSKYFIGKRFVPPSAYTAMNNLRGINLLETFCNQMFPAILKHPRSQLKHRINMLSSQVQMPIIQPHVESHLDIISHSYWKWSRCDS